MRSIPCASWFVALAGVALAGCSGGQAANEPVGRASEAWSSASPSLTLIDPHLSDHGGTHLLSPVITPILWSSVDKTDWVSFYTATASSHASRLAEYGITGITVKSQVTVNVASGKPEYNFALNDARCGAGDLTCKIQQELDSIVATFPPTRNSYYPVQLGLDAKPDTSKPCGGYHTSYLSSVCGAGAIADGDFSTKGSWTTVGTTVIDTTVPEATICKGSTGSCTGALSQTFTVQDCGAAGLAFWAQLTSKSGVSSDAKLKAFVWQPSTGVTLTVIEIDASASGWNQYILPLYIDATSLKGETVEVFFEGTTGSGGGEIEVEDVTTGMVVPYAVMYACCLGKPPDPSTPSLGFDQIVASHELLEAATDPVDLEGYWDNNNPNYEIGDLCFANAAGEVTAGGTSYTIASSWSNAANGCVYDASWTLPAPQLTSGSFEPSTFPTPWTLSGPTVQIAQDAIYAHGGVGYAILGSAGATDVLTSPTFLVPTNGHRSPGFWFYAETLPGGLFGGTSSLTVALFSVSSGTHETLATFGPADNAAGYVGYWVDLGKHQNDVIQVSFTSVNDPFNVTQYVIDDVSLQ
jgi:hypothetical protein